MLPASEIQMTIRFLPGKGSDCNILLIGGDKPILVDTGTGGCNSQTLQWIQKMVPIDKVDRIILTHCHFDHTGGASEIMRRTGAKIFIHEKDAEPVRNGDGWGTLSKMFGENSEALDVESMVEGDRFSSGDHDFEVIHTPGHTIGSICLYEKKSGTLISGDTVFVGGVGRWDLPTGDFDSLVASIRKLFELSPESIYPGHGPYAIGNGKQRIKEDLNGIGED
jgi:hydroxyacylglutathione hydrolase